MQAPDISCLYAADRARSPWIRASETSQKPHAGSASCSNRDSGLPIPSTFPTLFRAFVDVASCINTNKYDRSLTRSRRSVLSSSEHMIHYHLHLLLSDYFRILFAQNGEVFEGMNIFSLSSVRIALYFSIFFSFSCLRLSPIEKLKKVKPIINWNDSYYSSCSNPCKKLGIMNPVENFRKQGFLDGLFRRCGPDIVIGVATKHNFPAFGKIDLDIQRLKEIGRDLNRLTCQSICFFFI